MCGANELCERDIGWPFSPTITVNYGARELTTALRIIAKQIKLCVTPRLRLGPGGK